MCATCGCLTTDQPAPETGTYKCVECEKTGKSQRVRIEKGQNMPACSSCHTSNGHWIKT